MKDTENQSKSGINQFSKGLSTDTSPIAQPEGTLRFALNAVDESEIGDSLFPGNAESNEIAGNLKAGYIAIGKVYMGSGETVIFSVKPGSVNVSEIGIYSDVGTYTTCVNDESSISKLNFQVTHQIDAIYRLRRGCDRTIYWTDDYNPIRNYILNRPFDFETNGIFSATKTELFKRFEKIPVIDDIQIRSDGNLLSGSYNIAIQYLDNDLNPTEWITTSETVMVFNDNLNDSFGKIRGSTNEKTVACDFPVSNKSISIKYSNLDKDNYPFVRLALIEATNGSGDVSKCTATLELSTESGEISYTFTGNNTFTNLTVEEIAQDAILIDKAQSIEQVENRLILGNIKYKDNDLCSLQEYASAIKHSFTGAEKEISLDKIAEEGNPKSPTVNMEYLGYMPGEIYSFGIEWIFKDGTRSPVYHIPGNHAITSKYISRGNCSQNSFWGALEGTPIKHFKFPERTAGKPMVVKSQETVEYVDYYSFTFTHTLDTYSFIKVAPIDPAWSTPIMVIEIFADGATYPTVSQEFPINKTTGDVTDTNQHLTSLNAKLAAREGIQKITKIQTYIQDGTTQTFVKEDHSVYGISFFTCYNLSMTFSNEPVMATKTVSTTKATIFGIKFYNITLPPGTIGYNIVRNERTDNDKTVLDSGIILPVLNSKNKKMYNCFGNLIPTYDKQTLSVAGTAGFNNGIRKDAYCLVYPEFLFNNKEYQNFGLKKQGEYIVEEDTLVLGMTRDVMAGTSYNPEVHAKDPTEASEKDGFDLRTVIKRRKLNYVNAINSAKDISADEIKNVRYVKALSSINLEGTSTEEVFYNVSSDNNVAFFQLKNNLGENTDKDVFDELLLSTGKSVYDATVGSGNQGYDRMDNDIDGSTLKSYPMYHLTKNNADPYSDFRQREYINISPNYFTQAVPNVEGEGIVIFGGDTYIAPLTFFSSYFQDIKVAERDKKNNMWLKLAGIGIAVAGAAAAIFTAGASVAVSAIALTTLGIGAAISSAAVVIEQNKINDIYEKEYREGLKECLTDYQNDDMFSKLTLTSKDGSYTNPWSDDDEIQWAGNMLEDLWFETSVNINWRHGNTRGLPDFINPISNPSEKQIREYFINKLTVSDTDNDGGRLYTGYALAEQYFFNKDYARRNTEKPLFALGIEYDCCSTCKETFPQRVHYSEQSFQEELTDNYKIFLPNNYRDIDGETGEIINIFKIQNNLFIHTREGLWNLPKNYQERITDQIVSFIGTGSYFEIPPQKIVDDDTGNSYGTYHKWSRLKTPYGYFFVCESQNAICQFNGNKVEAISNQGMYYWFYNNIPMDDANIKDNPSNPAGSGFIGVYDSKKELIIYTKKHLVGGINKSWTVSYNLKKGTWGSFHSFLPYFYIQTPQYYFSLLEGNKNIWRHNVLGKYQEYYGVKKPFIIEYVITENPLINKLFENFTVFVETKKYNAATETFYDVPNIFFDKLLCYNSRQSSGVMNIVVKDKSDVDFLNTQVHNPLTSVIADRNERNWTLNDLRDMSKGTNTPLFIEKLDSADIQQNYFIDKVVNPDAINNLKEWYDIESFRDKYLVVRLTFNNFVDDIKDVKMITNFTVSNETISSR